MRFVAIDVEIANERYDSICQIGVVRFEDGREVDSECVLVDPKAEFGAMQRRLHRIDPDLTAGQPCFLQRHGWLCAWTADATIVSYTPFDRAAIGQACRRDGLTMPASGWADARQLARATWPGEKSYKLRDVARRLGISYRAHDALEDARACGLVVQQALALGATLEPRAPAGNSRGAAYPTPVRRIGDGDGALVGETIVFTGELSIPREEAADLAAEAGANVEPGVTRRTTMLVVGERDLQPGWAAKSGKHRKAEEMIDKGHSIRIVAEPDFRALAAITA